MYVRSLQHVWKTALRPAHIGGRSRHSLICVCICGTAQNRFVISSVAFPSSWTDTGRYRFTSCSDPRWKQPMIGALLLEVDWCHLARLDLPRPMSVSPRWKQPMTGALSLEVEWGHPTGLGLPRPMMVSTVLVLARRE
eukprot:scaffold54861_cov68-Phaeocystis_antarctica.AAC.1